MQAFTAIFGATGHLSLLQECARAALIFAFGLMLIRLSGRRTFSRWSALDVIISITAGSTLSRALTGNAPPLGTLAATFVLIALHWLCAHAAAKNRLASRLLEGEPIVLASQGHLDEKIRLRHAVSRADVAKALHQRGLQRLADAQQVTLEPNGQINVIRAAGGTKTAPPEGPMPQRGA